MGKLYNKLFQTGNVSITTDSSGNGTGSVTFPLAFTNVPDVKVVKPLNDVKGRYGVKNSPELILAKGRQPMGGISAYAVSGTETKVTQSTVITGVIASVADNKDGRSVVTDVAHGLVTGNVVFITGTGSYDGYSHVEKIDADTFIIDRVFVATETGVWALLNHDLVADDLIEIMSSLNYSGSHEVQSIEAADPSTYFNIDDTYVADDAKGYWKLLPTVTTTTMTVEVVGSDIRGGTITVNWAAFEK